MAGITLEEAKIHLGAWLKAELEVTSHQSYTIGTRSLSKANLGEIKKQIEFWQSKIDNLEKIAKNKGRNRVKRVVLRDL